MTKTSAFTSITPLPVTVSRKTALNFIHNHAQMIVLNPLVIRHESTDPPLNATPEEASSCQWYLITDKISYIPGGAAKSEVSYKAGFYDLPNGLQTHVFAPGGVDIRGRWKVGGNLPGEIREPQELGLNVPRDRLYIREDVELRCSVFFTNFVKKNLKKSHAVLVDALLAKAEAEEQRTSMIIKAKTEKIDSGRSSVVPDPRRTQSNNNLLLRLDTSQVALSSESRRAPGGRALSPSQPFTAAPTSLNGTGSLEACARGHHGPGCPHYYRNAYGALEWPMSAMEVSPVDAHRRQRWTMASPWKDPQPIPDSDTPTYSPVGQHPCFCEGGVHVQSCSLYPGIVKPRTTQSFPRYSMQHAPEQSPPTLPSGDFVDRQHTIRIRLASPRPHPARNQSGLDVHSAWLGSGSDAEDVSTSDTLLQPRPLKLSKRRSYQGGFLTS